MFQVKLSNGLIANITTTVYDVNRQLWTVTDDTAGVGTGADMESACRSLNLYHSATDIQKTSIREAVAIAAASPVATPVIRSTPTVK